MKKYLFLSALFCTALGMNAQWPTSYEGEPVQMTPDLQDYGDETVTNCHGVTFNVQYVAQHGTAGVDDMEYVISIVDKDGHNVTTLDKGLGLGVFQNRSWTAYNNTLYCDRDGNLLAITSETFYVDENAYLDFHSYHATTLTEEGESGPSNECNIQPQSSCNTPLNLRYEFMNSNNKVKLSWDAPQAEGVTGYMLYRRAKGEEFKRIKSLTATNYSDNIIGL